MSFACDSGQHGTMRLIAPSALRRIVALSGFAMSVSRRGMSNPAGDPSGNPGTSTSSRPFSSSHVLYIASSAPSTWFASPLSTHRASAGYRSGHPAGPAALAAMETHVPAVWRISFDACPSAGRSARWIYARYSAAVVSHPVLRLFFRRRPAVCRISSWTPSPSHRMAAR